VTLAIARAETRRRTNRPLNASGKSLALALLAGVLIESRAVAQQAGERPIVGGAGECPAPARVAAAIAQLTSPERRSQLSALARVSVADEGDHHLVSVYTGVTLHARQYDDAARDCQRRAQTAAVFAVLTLMPPELEPSPSAVPEVAPPKRVSRASDLAKPPAAFYLLELEPSLFADVGLDPGAPVVPLAWGGGLRAVIGPYSLAPMIGAAYAPELELATTEARVGLRRISGEVGARWRHRFGPFELAGDAFFVAVAARLRGIDLLRPHTEHAVELGGGLRAAIALGHGRIAPFIELHALVFPAPTEIRALPRGVAGHSPVLWLGASGGLSFAF